MKKIIPHTHMSKYHRLNTIAQLLRSKPHSIAQLSEKLGVCTKTIQWDLYEVLTEYGAVKRGRMWHIDDLAIKDNLNHDMILEEKFEINRELEERIQGANSAWFDLSEPKKARLLLAPPITKYFERKPHTKQNITEKDKVGSVEIEIEYTNIMEIKPLIYYYLPFIKVLAPKELADTIKDEIGGYFSEINV